MGLIVYPVLVDDADPNALHAAFPDIPALTATAGSPPELLLRAREKLMDVLRALEKAGDAWPAASSLADVRRAHPDHAGGVVWIDVEVEDTPVRITISMGERLVARIDQAANELSMTRSGYLAACARRQMVSGRSPLESSADQRILEEVAAAGKKIHETLGPQSPVGRTLADLDAVALDGLRHVAGGMAGAMKIGRRRGSAVSRAETSQDAEPSGQVGRHEAMRAGASGAPGQGAPDADA